MAEAQGAAGREKLPHKCRGRHPHLNAFDADCDARPALIMMGASNLWFGASQSIIVMPRSDDEKSELLADRLRATLGLEQIQQFGAQIEVIKALAGANKIDLSGVSDEDLTTAVAEALSPPESEEERTERRSNWDPVELLIPEWRYLQKPALFPQQANDTGLMVTEMPRGPKLNDRISRVVAVDQMKKVNALLGFTRLDAMDRVSDIATRSGQAHPQRPTHLDTGHRGPRRRNLPATRPRRRRGMGEGDRPERAVGGPPRGAHPELPAALLRDRCAGRPRQPPPRTALLAASHVVAHPDSGDGDVLRLRSGQPDRTPLRLAYQSEMGRCSRPSDLYYGIGQRRHPRRLGCAGRSGAAAEPRHLGAAPCGTLLL